MERGSSRYNWAFNARTILYPMNEQHAMAAKRWANRTVWAIVLATFFSDVSHEMATAVLPNFIRSVGMGAMALGLIEGVADFLVSLSKLGGGVLGHHVRHKKPWAALGYVITSVCTSRSEGR